MSRHGHARLTFAILLALMAVNCVDRQVLVALFPHLKSIWSLSDAELGGLASILAVALGLGCIPISLAADRYDRVKGIIAMALVWTAATIACGFATGYASLLAARAVVGLGEAGFATTSAALLSELFPERRRSTVIGAFIAAGVAGAVLGVVLGGVVAQHLGWRAAFFIAGAPGLILVLPLLMLGRTASATVAAARPARVVPLTRPLAVLRRVFAPRTSRLACVASGLQFVAVATVFAWLPSYFVRFHRLDVADAAWWTGLVVLLSAVCSIGWSALADRVAMRDARARLYVAAAASLATAAMLVPAFGLLPPGALASGLIVLGAAAMYGTVGPSAAVVADTVPASMRATSLAILATAQNLLGLAVGPWLTGRLSDAFGFAFALGVVPLASVLAALAFAAAAPSYGRDRAAALREQSDRVEASADEDRTIIDSSARDCLARWERAGPRS